MYSDFFYFFKKNNPSLYYIFSPKGICLNFRVIFLLGNYGTFFFCSGKDEINGLHSIESRLGASSQGTVKERQSFKKRKFYLNLNHSCLKASFVEISES